MSLTSALVKDINWRMQDLAFNRKNQRKKELKKYKPKNWCVHNDESPVHCTAVAAATIDTLQ